MTALFVLALILLLLASVDRWRRRPVLVVSTHSGEAIRGRRAFTPAFELTDAELIVAQGPVQRLGGRCRIPRANVTLIQVLPADSKPSEALAL